ncbi:flippase [Bacillus sp. es.034]|uniref:flippase n=1 Tax=Bacillus sp. es.034 TaxID=1761763 RepID=UPI000BF3729C|nr:flippase [Bacillus sp. es.034]PFG04480.1 O-antigen/teichoic acid export membrane protein [Bacillus sp. es.034]
MASISKNYLYNVIYQILLMILPIVTTPYVARVFGAEGVGIISYTQSVANYFLLFAMLGVKNYGNRSVARVRDDKGKLSETFWNIYSLQLLLTILAILAYSIFIFISSQNYKMILIIQVIFIMSAAFDISWFFFGLEHFKITVIRNIIIRILSVVAVFAFVKTSDDLWIYILITAVSALLSQIIVWPFIKQYIIFKPPSYQEIVKHLKPNMVLFIPVVAVSIYKIMAKIMLGTMSDIEQLGLYENADKIINIPLGLIVAFGSVMLPRMSNMAARGQVVESQKYIEKSMNFIMFIAFALAFGIAGIAPVFAPLFFGLEFIETGKIIANLAPTIIFISWANVIRTQYLIPNQQDKAYILSVIIGACVSLLLNIILVPKYAANGAVIGILAAEFSVAFIQTFMVRKEITIKVYLIKTLPFFLIGLIMYFFVRLCELIPINQIYLLFIQVIVGAIIYIVISYIYLSIIRDQNLVELKQKITKKNYKKQ